MSEAYFFSYCPKCKFDWKKGDDLIPQGGYIGDTIKCDKCKTRFYILVVLKEIKKKK